MSKDVSSAEMTEEREAEEEEILDESIESERRAVISVTDGFKTQGHKMRFIPQTKEKVNESMSKVVVQQLPVQEAEATPDKTVDKQFNNVSYREENKVKEIQPEEEIQKDKVDSFAVLNKKLDVQNQTLGKHVTDQELWKEDNSEKMPPTLKPLSESEAINEKLQNSMEVSKNKMPPSEQKEQAVENIADVDSCQLRPIAVIDQSITQAEQTQEEAKASAVMPASQPEPILSRVVTLKDERAKVSLMEGTTEMKPDQEVSVAPVVEVEKVQKLTKHEEAPVELVQPYLDKDKDKKYSEIKEVEFEVVDTDDTLPNDSVSQRMRQEKLVKSQEAEDKTSKTAKCKVPAVEESFKPAHIQLEQAERNTSEKLTTTCDEVITDAVEDIRSNVAPLKHEVGKLAPIEKKTLKRQEKIDSMVSEQSEPEVKDDESAYDFPNKGLGSQKTETAQTESEESWPTIIEEIQPVGARKKIIPPKEKTVKCEQTEVSPEIDVKEKKDVSQQQSKDQKFVKTQKERIKIPPTVALPEKTHEEQGVGAIEAKAVSVPDECASEGLGYKEQDERSISVAQVKEVASEKPQIVTDGESKQAQTKGDVVKDQPREAEASRDVSIEMFNRDVSGGTKPDAVKLSLTGQMSTTRPAEETKDKQKPVDTKTAVNSVREKTKKSKTQRLDQTTKAEDVQSKTVVVKHEYGCVAPLETTETKQVETKFSVAPVMDLASERTQVVKDGDVKSGALKCYTTPGELLKDSTTTKIDIYEMEDVSPKTVVSSDQDFVIKQSKSVQDKTENIVPTSTTLPEVQEETESKTSVVSKPDVKHQHSSVEPEAIGKLDVQIKTAFSQAEEIQHGQKESAKDTDVTRLTDIQSKAVKSIKTEQKSDKGKTKSVVEVQSKTVEYGSVAPLEVTETKEEQMERTVSVAPVIEIASEKHLIVKDGDLKSETLQRLTMPDKLVKQVASREKDAHEVRDEPTVVTTPMKHTRTEQAAELTGVTDIKKKRDHSARCEAAHYGRTSADFVKEQEQLTADSIQSNTDSVTTPTEHTASVAPGTNVSHVKPLIAKEQDPDGLTLTTTVDEKDRKESLALHVAAVSEPSVTDSSMLKMAERTDGATRLTSHLESHVQHVHPQEAETILCLESEVKESCRGIIGKKTCHSPSTWFSV